MRLRTALANVTLILTLAFCATVVLATEAEEAVALAEFEKAIKLEPNIDNGRKVYETCAVCHGPEGWGHESGAYPQIAGQLRSVIIKQLADIRAGNRSNPMMYPFTLEDTLGGAQEIADVAEYIAQLPMAPTNGQGSGFDLAAGEKLYQENCVDCHGERGEGHVKKHIPMIQGQHYNYLVRQFQWIKNGRRKNADEEMVEQIKGFRGRDIHDVLDYTSRLRPPKEKVAEPGWHNPDFPNFVRRHLPAPAYMRDPKGGM